MKKSKKLIKNKDKLKEVQTKRKNSFYRVMTSKVNIFLISFIFLSIFVVAVTTYYPQFSDTFNNFALDTTKWLTSSYCSHPPKCTATFNEASQPYYKVIEAAASGFSVDNIGAAAWTCLNNSFRNDSNLGYWDIYMNMSYIYTVAGQGNANSGSFDILVSNRSNSSSTQTANLIEYTHSLGTGQSYTANQSIYHIQIKNFPDLKTATLYINGVENHTEGLSLFNNWYVCWRSSISGRGATDYYSNSMQVNIWNFTTYFSDAPLNVSEETLQDSVFETSSQDYFLEFTDFTNKTTGTTSATFVYDSVEYPATISPVLNYQFNITVNDFDVPAVDSDTNFNFYFDYTIIRNGISEDLSTDTYVQQVNDTLLSECNSTNNIPYLNITMYELGTFVEKNASIGIAFLYWLGGGDTYEQFIYNNLDANQSRFNFCFAPGTEDIVIDGYTEFFYTDASNYTYPSSQYYWTESELSSDTELLDLYMITDNSTELVTFTVVDQNYDPVENAYVRVLYWDIFADNFYTASIGKTDVFGQTKQWIKRYTVWYEYQVVYNSKLYLQTQPLLEDQLERTLQIDLSTASNYDDLGNIDYSFTYDNSSEIFTFTWADTTGTVALGCLKVTSIQNTTVLNDECLSSTSGSLTYDLSGNVNSTYYGYAILEDDIGVRRIVKIIEVTFGTQPRFSRMGTHGVFPSILLFGTLVSIGIALGSLPFAIGLGIAGLVVIYIFGSVILNWGVLIALICVGILIVVLSRRRQ